MFQGVRRHLSNGAEGFARGLSDLTTADLATVLDVPQVDHSEWHNTCLRITEIPSPGPGAPAEFENDQRLLDLAEVVSVPDVFSIEELAAADRVAKTDTRIRLALDVKDAGLTQAPAAVGEQALRRLFKLHGEGAGELSSGHEQEPIDLLRRHLTEVPRDRSAGDRAVSRQLAELLAPETIENGAAVQAQPAHLRRRISNGVSAREHTALRDEAELRREVDAGTFQAAERLVALFNAVDRLRAYGLAADGTPYTPPEA
ncbi:hypothetical protein [Actinoallomurus acaciae]|uniref:Uncharacterized protein n=1 Tax=Actinoallomurus acaciae TaxID=502577 RepID=A0ABV5YEN3_9ACTN